MRQDHAKATATDESHTPSRDEDADAMPFIAFDASRPKRDSKHQKIIREHLGRQRRKKATQTRSTKQKGGNPDLWNFLCSCESHALGFLHVMADNPLISLQPCASCGKCRIVENVRGEPFPTPDPGPIYNNFGDPFDALPIPPRPYTHNLIRHFVDVTAPSTLPLPQLAHLFPNNAAALSLIAHDKILLQSALSIAATHLEYLQGFHGFTAACLEERGKAIAAVNKSLSDTSSIPSDGLIVSIAILGACETIAGNFASWQAHTLGLHRLIQLRGGIRPNDPIRDNILECDVVGATIFEVQPHLASYVGISEHKAFGEANLPYEFIIIHQQLRETFVEIRALCNIFETYVLKLGKQVSAADKKFISDFVDRRSRIEYQLLAVDFSNSDEGNSAASEFCRTAAQIFVNLVFRKMYPGSIIHKQLATRLRAATIAFDLDQASQHATTILLWASVLGYLALRSGPLQLWFAGWVSHCVSELDICDVEDLNYHLYKIAWLDGSLRRPCQEMWIELQQLRSIGVELSIMGDE